MHYYGHSAQILLRLSKSENSPTHIFLLCATSIQRTNWGRLRSWAVVYDFASRNFYYFKVARFSCKKLSNQKHAANTVPNTRRTTFWWMRGKHFYLSNLLCICLFLKPILTRQIISINSEEFLASRQVSVLRRNKAKNSSNCNGPFFTCSESPCTW